MSLYAIVMFAGGKRVAMKTKYFDINEDNLSVRCIQYYNDPKNADKAVICGHGFGGHKDNKAVLRFAEKILSKYKDTAVICFDLPCHGDDNYPVLTLEICDKYIGHVIEYAKKTYGENVNLYGYATSFGGYLFLKYIYEHGEVFKKTVLRCPAIDMYGTFLKISDNEKNRELLKKGKEISVGFDRKVKVKPSCFEDLKKNDIREYEFFDYADDILIIHGTSDEIVPYSDSVKFCEDNVISLIPIEKCDHRFTDPGKMDFAISETIKFMMG